jgi:hypothetical protein
MYLLETFMVKGSFLEIDGGTGARERVVARCSLARRISLSEAMSQGKKGNNGGIGAN